MNKALSLLVVSFCTVTAWAQTITFKTGYKPNTTYTQSMVSMVKNEVSYQGAPDVLDMIKQQGIENPTITEAKSTMNSETKTGKLTGTEMPVIMKMSIDNGTPTKVIPDNTLIYGKVKQEGLPVLDSINNPKMDANIKSALLQSMRDAMAQLYVTERKVKVGESFTVDMPFSMPMGPATLNMKNKVTYKLIKVEARKAHFDVTHIYTIDTVAEGQNMKGSGTGTGKLVHDLDNNFSVKMDMNILLNMGLEMEGVKLEIKSNNTTSFTTSISAGK
jgi:hypothetical protein